MGRRGHRRPPPGALVAVLVALATLAAACGSGATSSGLAGTTGPGATPTTTVPAAGPSTSTPSPPVSAPAAVPAGFVARSVNAVSTTHWWILGASPCGSSECPSIATTTDGGASFESLTAPGGPFATGAGATPAVSHIRFADAEDGWAFGPGLYATTDGGLSWTAIHLPGTVSALEAGQGAVFATVSPPAPACSRSATCTGATPQPSLWRVRPPSQDWTVVPAAGGVSVGLAVHGRSVWVMGSATSVDGPVVGTQLRYSADGGDRFVTEPQAVPGIACSYSPAGDAVVWSYCSGGHFQFAYRSTDAGAHFSAVGPEGGTHPTPDGFPNGSGLVAASSTVALAASNLPAGALIRTTDAGATWTTVQPPPDQTGQWSLIGFTTPQVGYALWEHSGATGSAGAQLWRTVDGGASWSAVAALPWTGAVLNRRRRVAADQSSMRWASPCTDSMNSSIMS